MAAQRGVRSRAAGCGEGCSGRAQGGIGAEPSRPAPAHVPVRRERDVQKMEGSDEKSGEVTKLQLSREGFYNLVSIIDP